jgi:hypothetical protein
MVVDLGRTTGSETVDSRQLAAGDVLEIALAPRSVRRLMGDHRGLHIRSAGAALWITQQGDPVDYVLSATEQFTVTRPGPVVLQGMGSR